MIKKEFILVIAVLLIFSSCSALRAVRYGGANTDDYKIFVQDTIKCSVTPSFFQKALIVEEKEYDLGGETKMSLTDYFARCEGNQGIIIIKNDSIIYEKYFGDYNRASKATVFSITKAITSLLCGIAIDEGLIKSVNDPVTDYIEELNGCDLMFKELKIEHLLDMRACLDFEENYSYNPFSPMAKLYYGGDILSQIKGLKFKNTPGTEHYYSSMVTAILGLVIDRATGCSFADYLQEKVWQPLGMEYDAMISLDDATHRVARVYGGLTTNAIDLAKIGKLYLNKGVWNGRRIVSELWIERSVSGRPENEGYSYCWETILIEDDTNKKTATSTFFVLGLFGQILYVSPEHNVIMVRLGDNKYTDYQHLFYKLAPQL